MKNYFDKNNSVLIIIYLFSALIIYWGFSTLQSGGLFANDDYYRKLYAHALSVKKEENYQEALIAFEKIKPQYSGYDAVLYQEADCAAKNADEGTVIKKLKMLLAKYPWSILAPQAKYDLAKAYVRTKDYEKAKRYFRDLILRHSKTKFAIGSHYYLGQIAKQYNKKNVAIEYWEKYLELSPDGRFSYDCAEAIMSTKKYLNQDEKYHIGLALFYSQMYDKAIYYLSQSPFDKSWYYLGIAYAASGNRPSARFVLKQGISKHTYSICNEKLVDAMNRYVRLSNGTEEDAWDELINMVQWKENAEDIALYNRAALDPPKMALDYYYRIFNTYPRGAFASEALWNIIWNEFTSNHLETALSLCKKHSDKYKDTLAAPKVLFWTGKILEKQGKKSEAKKYYRSILDRFPDDYYAFRADGRISGLSLGYYDRGWATSQRNKIGIRNFRLKLPYSCDQLERKYTRTAAELVYTGDSELIGLLDNFNDEFIDSWVQYKDGVKSKSIVAARDAIAEMRVKPDKSDIRWKYLYPLYFQDLINQYSHENGLDPYIVLSLMREESYFNNMAVSSSNARGLMQILPPTANDIAKWHNLGYVNEILLFNPETNIKFGTAYLNYIGGKLDGKMVYAVGAYNGGPGAISRWLKRLDYADTDEFIESIPYEQTKMYIKKVYRSYWNYRRIYGF